MDLILKDRKRFATWMWVKRDLHDSHHTPPLFKEGEVWWCHAGENLGIGINGKGDSFTRPILIFKKYDKSSFLGLPLTTKLKTGSWYEQINFGGLNQTVNLIQGRSFDYRRLKEKLGELRGEELKQVRYTYIGLHSYPINRPPASNGGSRGQVPKTC